MVPGARWLAVAAVALGVTSAPVVARAIPVVSSDVSAVRLLDRIREEGERPWSGEVRSLGTLQVPITGSGFGGIGRLLGEETRLRVWWSDADNWRIDRLRATGESDTVLNGGLVVRWNYEENRVNFAPYSSVRLPDDVDVVPGNVARRLLAGARPDELSRLPGRRVAGHTVAGLRLVPDDDRSTISHVDVWAEVSSGLPLRVEVYAGPADAPPVLTTELVSLDLGEPPAGRIDFQLSSSLDFSRGVALDEAAGANAFAPLELPGVDADLPRRGRPEALGAVGVYGRGATTLLAVPLRRSVAERLREQLQRSRDARVGGASVALEVGPVSVRMVEDDSATFILAGTVTPETLTSAAADLLRGVRRTR